MGSFASGLQSVYDFLFSIIHSQLSTIPMSINKLRQQLWDYDRRYRIGEPVISDTEYDLLLRKL
ncbi:MAG: hypothetical protein LBQ50_09070, partial [Planctomycetaceae bacterium]|nr:hypothetical protein [Planctomycetaceae bacterium]